MRSGRQRTQSEKRAEGRVLGNCFPNPGERSKRREGAARHAGGETGIGVRSQAKSVSRRVNCVQS